MFSGIVEDLGVLVSATPRGAGRTLVIRTRLPVDTASDLRGEGTRPGLRLGDSVAVNGACLTVEALSRPDQFTVSCGRETLERTTLGRARPGDRLHLERALRLGDRLDGHLVSGHVDGIGSVLSVEHQQESIVVWVEVPAELASFVAEKGSICLDGTSLTVNEVRQRALRVNLIPYTADATTLASRRPGDSLNVEVDLIARYVARLLEPVLGEPSAQAGGLTREKLAALGFIPTRQER